MPGWIKIERDIQKHWIWQEEKDFRRWIIILLNVNHNSRKFPVCNEIFVCNPGESFRSVDEWSRLFNCSKPTTLKFFKLLESDGMIRTKTVGKGNRRKHLLIVVNWQKYQQNSTENFTENKPETLPEINRTLYPNKNDKENKNEKNEKNIHIDARILKISEEMLSFFNFNSVNNPDKEKMIQKFLKALEKKNKLNDFINQFQAYKFIKSSSENKRHSLTSFIGDPEDEYLNGGWNSRNWISQIKEEPTKQSSIMKPPYHLIGLL